MATPEAQPAPPPEHLADPGRPARHRLTAVLLAVLGAAALIGGATGLGLELTRTPTQAEIEAAGIEERALRWRFLTAGEIFPAAVQYGNGPDGRIDGSQEKPLTARRVGIAPPKPCAEAVDPEMAGLLVRYGCRTMLVATYVDDSLTQAVTVGVAVMPGAEQAREFVTAVEEEIGLSAGQETGVRAHPFHGTLADRFGDDGRQKFSLDIDAESPYLYFAAAGWNDGRTRAEDTQAPPRLTFARPVVDQVRKRFEESADPCAQAGVSC
ncbi:hypothetical protein [Thermomonospora amylolytica]|uniref:hypothetical protein n=1 Tax=Thermomonospora amylolytica TaxID=1411117 RepID=UPI00130023F4|nr:hypothetical protein [Thermomonospora amylolytica]